MNKGLMLVILATIVILQDFVATDLTERLNAKIDQVRLLQEELKLTQSERDELIESINDTKCGY